MQLSLRFLLVTILGLAIFAGCAETPTATPMPTPTGTTILATPAPTPTRAPMATPTPSPAPSPAATATPTSTPGGGATVQLTIQNFRLENRTMRVGDTIVWTQRDAAPHTTTSGTSPTSNGIWNSGTLQSGQSFRFTFNQTGAFPYFCAIHPSMTAVITVVGALDIIPSEATPTPSTGGTTGNGGDYVY